MEELEEEGDNKADSISQMTDDEDPQSSSEAETNEGTISKEAEVNSDNSNNNDEIHQKGNDVVYHKSGEIEQIIFNHNNSQNISNYPIITHYQNQVISQKEDNSEILKFTDNIHNGTSMEQKESLNIEDKTNQSNYKTDVPINQHVKTMVNAEKDECIITDSFELEKNLGNDKDDHFVRSLMDKGTGNCDNYKHKYSECQVNAAANVSNSLIVYNEADSDSEVVREKILYHDERENDTNYLTNLPYTGIIQEKGNLTPTHPELYESHDRDSTMQEENKNTNLSLSEINHIDTSINEQTDINTRDQFIYGDNETDKQAIHQGKQLTNDSIDKCDSNQLDIHRNNIPTTLYQNCCQKIINIINCNNNVVSHKVESNKSQTNVSPDYPNNSKAFHSHTKTLSLKQNQDSSLSIPYVGPIMQCENDPEISTFYNNNIIGSSIGQQEDNDAKNSNCSGLEMDDKEKDSSDDNEDKCNTRYTILHQNTLAIGFDPSIKGVNSDGCNNNEKETITDYVVNNTSGNISETISSYDDSENHKGCHSDIDCTRESSDNKTNKNLTEDQENTQFEDDLEFEDDDPIRLFYEDSLSPTGENNTMASEELESCNSEENIRFREKENPQNNLGDNHFHTFTPLENVNNNLLECSNNISCLSFSLPDNQSSNFDGDNLKNTQKGISKLSCNKIIIGSKPCESTPTIRIVDRRVHNIVNDSESSFDSDDIDIDYYTESDDYDKVHNNCKVENDDTDDIQIFKETFNEQFNKNTKYKVNNNAVTRASQSITQTDDFHGSQALEENYTRQALIRILTDGDDDVSNFSFDDNSFKLNSIDDKTCRKENSLNGKMITKRIETEIEKFSSDSGKHSNTLRNIAINLNSSDTLKKLETVKTKDSSQKYQEGDNLQKPQLNLVSIHSRIKPCSVVLPKITMNSENLYAEDPKVKLDRLNHSKTAKNASVVNVIERKKLPDKLRHANNHKHKFNFNNRMRHEQENAIHKIPKSSIGKGLVKLYLDIPQHLLFRNSTPHQSRLKGLGLKTNQHRIPKKLYEKGSSNNNNSETEHFNKALDGDEDSEKIDIFKCEICGVHSYSESEINTHFATCKRISYEQECEKCHLVFLPSAITKHRWNFNCSALTENNYNVTVLRPDVEPKRFVTLAGEKCSLKKSTEQLETKSERCSGSVMEENTNQSVKKNESILESKNVSDRHVTKDSDVNFPDSAERSSKYTYNDESRSIFQCKKCNLCYMTIHMLRHHFINSHSYIGRREACQYCYLVFPIKSKRKHVAVHHNKLNLSFQNLDIKVFYSEQSIKSYLSQMRRKRGKQMAKNPGGVNKDTTFFGDTDSSENSNSENENTSNEVAGAISLIKNATVSNNDKTASTETTPQSNDVMPVLESCNIIYKCLACGLHFMKEKYLIAHLDLYQNNCSNLSKMPCAVCSLEFTNETNLDLHMLVHHEIFKISIQNLEIKAIGDMSKKDIHSNVTQHKVKTMKTERNDVKNNNKRKWLKQNNTKKGYIDKVYNNNLYRCSKCLLHFLEADTLRMHIDYFENKPHHANASKRFCPDCKYAFNEPTLGYHKKIHHKQMGITNFNIVTDHELLEIPVKKSIILYRCRECNVCFPQQDYCKEHMIRHEKLSPKEYGTCKFCQYNIPSRLLAAHRKEHKGQNSTVVIDHPIPNELANAMSIEEINKQNDKSETIKKSQFIQHTSVITTIEETNSANTTQCDTHQTKNDDNVGPPKNIQMIDAHTDVIDLVSDGSNDESTKETSDIVEENTEKVQKSESNSHSTSNNISDRDQEKQSLQGREPSCLENFLRMDTKHLTEIRNGREKIFPLKNLVDHEISRAYRSASSDLQPTTETHNNNLLQVSQNNSLEQASNNQGHGVQYHNNKIDSQPALSGSQILLNLRAPVNIATEKKPPQLPLNKSLPLKISQPQQINQAYENQHQLKNNSQPRNGGQEYLSCSNNEIRKNNNNFSAPKPNTFHNEHLAKIPPINTGVVDTVSNKNVNQVVKRKRGRPRKDDSNTAITIKKKCVETVTNNMIAEHRMQKAELQRFRYMNNNTKMTKEAEPTTGPSSDSAAFPVSSDLSISIVPKTLPSTEMGKQHCSRFDSFQTELSQTNPSQNCSNLLHQDVHHSGHQHPQQNVVHPDLIGKPSQSSAGCSVNSNQCNERLNGSPEEYVPVSKNHYHPHPKPIQNISTLGLLTQNLPNKPNYYNYLQSEQIPVMVTETLVPDSAQSTRAWTRPNSEPTHNCPQVSPGQSFIRPPSAPTQNLDNNINTKMGPVGNLKNSDSARPEVRGKQKPVPQLKPLPTKRHVQDRMNVMHHNNENMEGIQHTSTISTTNIDLLKSVVNQKLPDYVNPRSTNTSHIPKNQLPGNHLKQLDNSHIGPTFNIPSVLTTNCNSPPSSRNGDTSVYHQDLTNNTNKNLNKQIFPEIRIQNSSYQTLPQDTDLNHDSITDSHTGYPNNRYQPAPQNRSQNFSNYQQSQNHNSSQSQPQNGKQNYNNQTIPQNIDTHPNHQIYPQSANQTCNNLTGSPNSPVNQNSSYRAPPHNMNQSYMKPGNGNQNFNYQTNPQNANQNRNYVTSNQTGNQNSAYHTSPQNRMQNVNRLSFHQNGNQNSSHTSNYNRNQNNNNLPHPQDGNINSFPQNTTQNHSNINSTQTENYNRNYQTTQNDNRNFSYQARPHYNNSNNRTGPQNGNQNHNIQDRRQIGLQITGDQLTTCLLCGKSMTFYTWAYLHLRFINDHLTCCLCNKIIKTADLTQHAQSHNLIRKT